MQNVVPQNINVAAGQNQSEYVDEVNPDEINLHVYMYIYLQDGLFDSDGEDEEAGVNQPQTFLSPLARSIILFLLDRGQEI